MGRRRRRRNPFQLGWVDDEEIREVEWSVVEVVVGWLVGGLPLIHHRLIYATDVGFCARLVIREVRDKRPN